MGQVRDSLFVVVPFHPDSGAVDVGFNVARVVLRDLKKLGHGIVESLLSDVESASGVQKADVIRSQTDCLVEVRQRSRILALLKPDLSPLVESLRSSWIESDGGVEVGKRKVKEPLGRIGAPSCDVACR